MKASGVLLIVMAVFTSLSAAQVSQENLVVPGQRIGKWTLGITIADLVAMNGQQNSSDGAPRRPASGSAADLQGDLTEHHWQNLGLIAGTRDGQRVLYLAARQTAASSPYKTAEGIGYGSSRFAVEAAFGRPGATTVPELGFQTWIYDERGIALVFPTIPRLYVFRPNSAKSIWKF